VRLLRASITGKASSRGERARELGRQARDRIYADSTSTIRAHPRERARSSLLSRRYCGPCPAPRRPMRGTCTARRRRLSSKRPSSRPKARRPASASRGAHGTTRARKASRPRCTRAVQGASRQPGAHVGQGAAPRHARASPRRRRPQHHQRLAYGQRGDTCSGGLPPSTRWALRQPGGPLADAGTTGNPRVQPGDPHGELPPSHIDRQIQRGDRPLRMAQRLPLGVSAGRGHHRRGYHP
jgi:hypothetical protein